MFFRFCPLHRHFSAAQNLPRGVYKSPAEWYTGSRSPGAAARFARADHGGYRARQQPHKAAAAGSHAPADPAVQADAIRGKELLHTPGAAKAVTENTQPAYYSAEMFAADPRRAEVAAQRQMQYYKQALSDPVTIAVRNYGREIILPSGRRIPPEEQAQIITQAAAAYASVTEWLGPATEVVLKTGSYKVDTRPIPADVTGRKAFIHKTRKSAAILDDLGKALPDWIDALGLVLEIGSNIEENRDSYGAGASKEKLCWDIIVDVVLSGGTMLTATAIGAYVGAVCVPVAGPFVGALIGYVIEENLHWLTDEMKLGEKNLRDQMKGWVK
ncbi:MAG: hypothetical protein IJ412_05490 [Oscillospiraceae bacterium]|nr:hypothetical protein [Oscillospiraceae bacterium]